MRDATSMICLRLASLTRPFPDRAFETVAVDRPVSRAISLIVIIIISPPSIIAPGSAKGNKAIPETC
jgi:hypothetical protein